MNSLINKLLSFIRIILLLASFAITLYVMLYMYYNLGKEPFGRDFFDFASSLFPFILLLIICTVNMVGRYKTVNNNTFYNITSVLVLGCVLYMGCRALFDQNMVLWHKTNYRINFEYFADQLFQIKAMLYAVCGANVFLIIEAYLSKDELKKVKKVK